MASIGIRDMGVVCTVEVIKSWLWFIVVQLVTLVFFLIGLVLLAPLCLLQAWKRDAKSIKDGRVIDRWAVPINLIYGNPEDGVSGTTAIVEGAYYLPFSSVPARAYRWSALRNSVDGLKYVFAWKRGTLLIDKHYKFLGKDRHFKAGWQNENGFNVPVISLW